jgi:hypothetical protein
MWTPQIQQKGFYCFTFHPIIVIIFGYLFNFLKYRIKKNEKSHIPDSVTNETEELIGP